MYKTLAMLLSLPLIFGCATDGLPIDDSDLAGAFGCTDELKVTLSNFTYGESLMNTIAISEVVPGSGFLIRLSPVSGFDAATVTVTGSSTNAGWISGTGSASTTNNNLLFVGCAPNEPEGTEYKYEIKVEQGEVTNILDPRARLVL
jgi:hypothetical protein